MRRLGVLVGAAVLVLALAVPAAGITWGTPDGNDHPFVGLMVAEVLDEGELVPAWRCSGALISPTVFVTAGHCTFGADGAQVWFDADVVRGEDEDPDLYPFGGGVRGEAHTRPGHDNDAFFLADLGVVVLDDPVVLGEYAELPAVDALDALGKGRNAAAVTAVGYGLQGIKPQFLANLSRTRADLFVVNRTGFIGLKQAPGSGWFALSSDARGGGTCFGDSGGPVLRDGAILGVVSFGIDQNCAAPGGAYRIDRSDDLEFIEAFLEQG
jgi:hypothetical protein